MEIYFAPMESITTSIYREVYQKHFGGIDRFYTPFLSITQTHRLQNRERREVLPFRAGVVPQVLSASAEDTLWALRELRSYGYGEVDLNLGCPYPTVFTKGKGAGMLADPERLDRYLDAVFSADGIPGISAKTRIGVSDPGEARRLAEVYRKYPFRLLTVHPRVREQFYTGTPDLKAWEYMLEHLDCPLCYNGDIRSAGQAAALAKRYPGAAALMIGRGLLADPLLAERCKTAFREAGIPEGTSAGMEEEPEMPAGSACAAGGIPAAAGPGKQQEERPGSGLPEEKRRVYDFLRDLENAYLEAFSGEQSVLFKMKEHWSYLGDNYPEAQRALLDIKKAKKLSEYEQAVRRILRS